MHHAWVSDKWYCVTECYHECCNCLWCTDHNVQPTTDSIRISTTLPPPPYMTSDGVSKLYQVSSPSVTELHPPTPAASSLCSSSCQGAAGRTSSLATASICLEDDETWDNVPRPPSLSYCVSTTGYRGALLPDSMLSRRQLPLGPVAQLHTSAATTTINAVRIFNNIDIYSRDWLIVCVCVCVCVCVRACLRACVCTYLLLIYIRPNNNQCH